MSCMLRVHIYTEYQFFVKMQIFYWKIKAYAIILNTEYILETTKLKKEALEQNRMKKKSRNKTKSSEKLLRNSKYH